MPEPSSRASLALALAAAASLWFSLPLRSAAHLGFYDSDYNQIWTFLHTDRSLLSHFLTDEPLFNVYHALRFRLLGADPRLHHVLQGVLLAANAVLAFGLVWRLAANRLLPFLFLLLFLTYPNRGQAYYWPGAAYVLMLFCLLLALHRCLNWWREGQRRDLAAAWVFYTAAVFIHEAAFGFLGIVAALGVLERGRKIRWPEDALALAPFLLSNAAYLLVRQTRWFGAGDPGFSLMRELRPERVWHHAGYSLQTHFGHLFWTNTEPLLREGASTQSMVPAFVGIIVLLLGAVWLASESFAEWRQAAEGTLVWPLLFAGAAVYTAREQPLDLVLVLRVALHAVVFLALASAVQRRFFPAPLDGGLLKLAAFGGAWFFAAYSPAYLLYLAPRHSYIPSFGISLVLAAALAWPASCASDRRRRRLLEGASLGLAALICTGFYAASLGERGRWVWAAAFIADLKQQMLEMRPNLPKDTRVVILDLPNPPADVPLLAGYALEAALRHWYGHDQILANTELTPQREDFLLPYVHAPQPYDRLLVFYREHEGLRPVPALLFEDGTEVRLGTGIRPPPEGGTPLFVVTGQRVP